MTSAEGPTTEPPAQPLADALASVDRRALVGDVVDAVADRYGLTGSWHRIPSGERSLAFRLETPRASRFVKLEPGGSTESADRAARLGDLAARDGVPTARPIRDRSGAAAVTVGDVVVSVADLVPGTPLCAPVDADRAAQIGTALGRLHRSLAELDPRPTRVTADDEPWLVWDRTATEAAFERVETLIRRRSRDRGGFAGAALEHLAERRSWLDGIGRLLTALPPLTRQLGHGDVAAPNLLVDGDRLTALVDFSSAGPQLRAYEIGRIAFAPELVLSPEPEALAAALLRAYATTGPADAGHDLAHARTCALVQLVRSTYPLSARYAGSGRFPDRLEDFWLRRQRTARHLLETAAP